MHDHQTSSPAYQGGADTGRASSRSERAAARRQVRERRHAVAAGVASNHGGVARLGDLLAAGLTREQIRAEVEAGVWSRPGCHTVFVAGGTPSQLARFWCALWESGSSSVLDGVSALQAAGLSGWSQGTVDVTVPNSLKPRQLAGVRHHRLRTVGEHVATGLRRTKPHVAAVRAALWAASERQAATLLTMAVQQRLAPANRVLEHWQTVRIAPRRTVLNAVIRDICDGVHSMGELDFARACRGRGLPEPTRQEMRIVGSLVAYLDVLWEDLGVHAEIQGVQHTAPKAVIEDSLRANELQIRRHAAISLQIPVVGLRLRPDDYLDQVSAALAAGRQHGAP